MLINCVVYRAGTKLADITIAEISDYLAQPGCFVWVALRDASDDELAVMQQEFDLHDLSVEDARHGHQRPKIEEYGKTVFTRAAPDRVHPHRRAAPGRGECVHRAELRAVGAQPQHAGLPGRARALRDTSPSC